jgi:hypothetical protein
VFTVDASEITKLTKDFERASKNWPRDSKRFLISTQRAAKAEATKAATKVYNIRRTRIAGSWWVEPVNLTTLSFVLIGKGKSFSILEFMARMGARGLAVTVIKGGARTRFRDSFTANAPSPKKVGPPTQEGGVAPTVMLGWMRRVNRPTRRTSKGHYKGRLRQQIRPIFGPSPANMLNNPKVLVPFGEAMAVRLMRDLAAALERALKNG